MTPGFTGIKRYIPDLTVVIPVHSVPICLVIINELHNCSKVFFFRLFARDIKCVISLVSSKY